MGLFDAIYGTAIYGSSNYGVITKRIASSSMINVRSTVTLSSVSVISYNEFGDIMEEGWDEIIETPEFEKEVTYRKFSFYRDNMTGDLDRSTYTDYTIFAEVQPVETNDNVVRTGQLQLGDAIIFIPSKIDRNSSGGVINPYLRPTIRDEIVFFGIRYIIQSITSERIGQFEIFSECKCKRMDNLNPTLSYNTNYTARDGDIPGRGFS